MDHMKLVATLAWNKNAAKKYKYHKGRKALEGHAGNVNKSLSLCRASPCKAQRVLELCASTFYTKSVWLFLFQTPYTPRAKSWYQFGQRNQGQFEDNDINSRKFMETLLKLFVLSCKEVKVLVQCQPSLHICPCITCNFAIHLESVDFIFTH